MNRKEIVLTREGDCIICTSHTTREGYTIITREGKQVFLHRVVYEMYNGGISQGLIIRHTCDNPRCVNPKHLLIGEHKDNVADMVSRDRHAKGTSHGRSKLTEADVVTIRKDKVSTNAELARRYCVDRRVIREVKAVRTWKHVL